jgi:hypothetical protein
MQLQADPDSVDRDAAIDTLAQIVGVPRAPSKGSTTARATLHRAIIG